jgi:hypothetical protein
MPRGVGKLARSQANGDFAQERGSTDTAMREFAPIYCSPTVALARTGEQAEDVMSAVHTGTSRTKTRGDIVVSFGRL